MFNRSVVSAMVGGMALGAGVTMAMMAHAQYAGQPPAGSPPPAGMAVALTAPPPGGPGAAGCAMQVTALAADTFVTVKDTGDSQTVSVFKVDPKGTNHLAHKAKFFY